MKKIFFSFIVVVTITACNSENEAELIVSEALSIEESKDHSDKNEVIQLNNGEKWEVNSEMMKPILEGKLELASYNDFKDTNYLLLAERLKEKNTSLIKNCSMKGEAHDELHKWLHPHMKLIDKLSLSENSDEANETIIEIKASFDTFMNYFQ